MRGGVRPRGTGGNVRWRRSPPWCPGLCYGWLSLGSRARRTAIRRTAMPASTAAKLILAIDQGTHASRALVFERGGTGVAEGAQEIGRVRPQPDWAEQDGEKIVASVLAAVERAPAPSRGCPPRRCSRGS